MLSRERIRRVPRLDRRLPYDGVGRFDGNGDGLLFPRLWVRLTLQLARPPLGP